MALTEQQLQLALKGYPVKTSENVSVHNLIEVGDKYLVGLPNKGRPEWWNIDGKNSYRYTDLHLDHEEARRINFVPKPEFGDEIEVFNGKEWWPTRYICKNDSQDTLGVLVEETGGEILAFKNGLKYETEWFELWRWPSDSPYNISDRYEVLKNGEPVEVGEEKMKCIEEILKEE